MFLGVYSYKEFVFRNYKTQYSSDKKMSLTVEIVAFDCNIVFVDGFTSSLSGDIRSIAATVEISLDD